MMTDKAVMLALHLPRGKSTLFFNESVALLEYSKLYSVPALVRVTINSRLSLIFSKQILIDNKVCLAC